MLKAALGCLSFWLFETEEWQKTELIYSLSGRSETQKMYPADSGQKSAGKIKYLEICAI